MADAGEFGGKCSSNANRGVGSEGTEKGNTARPMVHLSMVQYRTARLTRQLRAEYR